MKDFMDFKFFFFYFFFLFYKQIEILLKQRQDPNTSWIKAC